MRIQNPRAKRFGQYINPDDLGGTTAPLLDCVQYHSRRLVAVALIDCRLVAVPFLSHSPTGRKVCNIIIWTFEILANKQSSILPYRDTYKTNKTYTNYTSPLILLLLYIYISPIFMCVCAREGSRLSCNLENWLHYVASRSSRGLRSQPHSSTSPEWMPSRKQGYRFKFWGKNGLGDGGQPVTALI